MMQATAVVLDSEQIQREEIRTRLSRCGVLPICFKDEWICLENIYHIEPGFTVLRTDSVERLSRFVNLSKAINSNIPIMVISQENSIEDFVRNNWLDNLFFLSYPADEKAYQGAIELLASARPEKNQPVLVAGSTQRKKLLRGIPLLGLARDPILIQGEQGVGKKLIATAIHGFSTNKRERLEFIDATEISEKWISNTVDRFEMTERSGAPQSAYAIQNIDKLPFRLQSQLLLLMEKVTGNEFGAKGTMPSAPLISISGCDLESQAEKGVFRKDLYHRLSVLKLTVPPLRAYRGDIISMAEYFAAHYSINQNGGICRLPDEVFKAFSSYNWPGNVSELKQKTKRLVSIDKRRLQNESSSSSMFESLKSNDRRVNACVNTDDVRNYIKSHSNVSLKQAKARYASQVEKKLMKAALAQTNGNCKKAAVLLNISYKSMLNKAKEYKLVGQKG